MNIFNLQYGFGQEIEDQISLNIYISGCKNNKKCDIKKCHNQLLRKFDIGSDYKSWYNELFNKIEKDFIDCIVLLGGEPLDQELNELIFLINMINTIFYFKKIDLPIYIYTGYLYENKKEMIDCLFKIGIENFCIGEYKENENRKKWLI